MEKKYRNNISRTGMKLMVLILALTVPFVAFAQDQPRTEAAPVAPEPQTEQSQQVPVPGLSETVPEITPVSDEELRQFASAVMEVQNIQVQTQQNIEEAIAQSDLSRERFVEIFESSQAQGAEEATEVTADEQETFDSIVDTIATLQLTSQQSMTQAVRDTGMDLERFNQILSAVQQNPTLMERLQPHLEEAQSEPETSN